MDFFCKEYFYKSTFIKDTFFFLLVCLLDLISLFHVTPTACIFGHTPLLQPTAINVHLKGNLTDPMQLPM